MTTPFENMTKEENGNEEQRNLAETSKGELAKKQASRERVFKTPCKYGCFMWGIIIFSIVVCLLTIIPIALDKTTAEEDKDSAFHTVLWSTIAIMILYIFILPVSVEVRSDASIGVKTAVITYTFIDAVRAYQSDGMFEGAMRPRFKFATSLKTRVIVRRRNELWDLAVSPKDVDGFMQAVADVTRELELGGDATGEGGVRNGRFA